MVKQGSRKWIENDSLDVTEKCLSPHPQSKSITNLGVALWLHKDTAGIKGFPGSSAVKNLPVMQETQGWEDPLQKG